MEIIYLSSSFLHPFVIFLLPCNISVIGRIEEIPKLISSAAPPTFYSNGHEKKFISSGLLVLIKNRILFLLEENRNRETFQFYLFVNNSVKSFGMLEHGNSFSGEEENEGRQEF